MAGLGTPFFSVLNVPFISVHFLNETFISVHFSSFWRLMKPKWTLRAFPFIFNERKWTQWTKGSFVLNRNERSERNVHFHWTEMNAVNETFICTERKWTQWTNRSVVLNGNERCDHFLRSFPFIFEFLAIFEPLLTPKRPFFGHFWGLLGPA